MKRVLIACLITMSLLTAGVVGRAAEGGAPASAESGKKTTRAKQMPFRGKLVAVDATARTVTLSGKEKNRTFRVAATGKISKDGQPAELDQVKAGDSVGGLAKATETGEWEVVILNVGIKPGKAKAEDKAADDVME